MTTRDPMDEKGRSVRARIEAVCRTIEDRLAEEPTLDELAASADLSTFHFHRLFRGLVGETVAGYSRRLRLERAAYRIEHGESDLLVVALDAGYGSHEAFTRAFRRQFVVPPSEYRARVKGEADAAPEAHEPDVRIERVEPQKVAFVRHVGPYSGVGDTYAALFAHLVTHAVDGTRWSLGDPPAREVYLNDPRRTKPADLRTEIWMPVSRAANA
ncbi:MAG: AraC family transcriptional regulator [Planctomycetota bacterium]